MFCVKSDFTECKKIEAITKTFISLFIEFAIR